MLMPLRRSIWLKGLMADILAWRSTYCGRRSISQTIPICQILCSIVRRSNSAMAWAMTGSTASKLKLKRCSFSQSLLAQSHFISHVSAHHWSRRYQNFSMRLGMTETSQEHPAGAVARSEIHVFVVDNLLRNATFEANSSSRGRLRGG